MSDNYLDWKRVLSEIQEKQVQPLLVNQHIFLQFAACTEPYVGSTHAAALSDWIGECSVAFAATAIRRTLDRRRDTISLVRFLLDLRGNYDKLSRERMRAEFRAALPAIAVECGIADQKGDEMFNYGIRQTSSDRLNAAIVGDDIKRLESKAASVTQIANAWITHTSKSPRVSSLKIDDLHDAVDTIKDVYSRYYALVCCKKPVWAPLDAYECTPYLHCIWPAR